MKSIGWIGVGIMGKPMVRNLQKAGYTLHIYARNREKVADVIQEGAIFHDTIGDCAQGRDAVITMVGFPKDVEEVYFAPGNILDRADPGTYLIDMTTTSPALAQRIFQQGRAAGPAGFGCPGDRRGHRGPGGHPLHFGGRGGGGLPGLPAPAGGHGDQPQPPGPRRLRTACQTGQPNHDCRDLVRSLRGTALCPGQGAGRAENSWGRWPRGRRGASRWTLWGEKFSPETMPRGFSSNILSRI